MIQVKNLDFTYQKSKKQALSQLNFDIEKGEVFGFLGPSGAGKTTTQRLIIGLLRRYSGHIEVFGKERSAWGKEFYERIGVAFDFPNLYIKLTAYENLSLISSYYQNKPDDIDALLDRVGLLPDRDKKIEDFSKGMKMRLNFIRAFMHQPEILFFDEPTSGLDPVNAKIIKDMIIEQKNKGKTIFLTTHNMTVAEQLCDRVAFIVDGTISVIDKPKDLMMAHGSNRVTVEYLEKGKILQEMYPLDTINTNENLYQLLRHKEIKTIHSQEATLEDIFIKLTGRRLL